MEMVKGKREGRSSKRKGREGMRDELLIRRV
jgi:hypothetical protein